MDDGLEIATYNTFNSEKLYFTFALMAKSNTLHGTLRALEILLKT